MRRAGERRWRCGVGEKGMLRLFLRCEKRVDRDSSFLQCCWSRAVSSDAAAALVDH